jgi:threonine dehydrogenase-like Zn-dependent dehydrogenase
MRALIVSGWGEPAEFADVEEPAPSEDECLVAVHSVLLGAGDVFFSQGVDYKQDGASFTFPHVPGFRGAGVVVSAPSGVPEAGTRVAINGVVGCGACRRCAAGAENLCSHPYLLGLSSGHSGSAAERIAVPVRQLHALPDSMAFTDSLLASDAALLIHAYRRGRLMLGESLAIVGAGRIGTMAVAVARAAGANPIVAIDSSGESRAAASRAGATRVIDPTGLSAAELAAAVADACGTAPDVVLEAVGKPETLGTAVSLGGAGGRTILLGLLGGVRIEPSYYADVISKENELITTFGKTNDNFRMAVGLIARGQVTVGSLPVRTFAWAEALEAWRESVVAPGGRNQIVVPTNGANGARGQD